MVHATDTSAYDIPKAKTSRCERALGPRADHGSEIETSRPRRSDAANTTMARPNTIDSQGNFGTMVDAAAEMTRPIVRNTTTNPAVNVMLTAIALWTLRNCPPSRPSSVTKYASQAGNMAKPQGLNTATMPSPNA